MSHYSITITREQAAAFFVNHHRFQSSTLPSLTSVEEVYQHLRLIQYDPLNPCGRNVDLVLQSRLKDYHPDGYLDWAYGKAKGIDGYDKQLCILPVDDWGYLHYFMDRMSPARLQFIEENRQELDSLLRHIAEHGPVASDVIKDDRRVDIGWYGPMGWSKTAIESLWRLGEIVSIRQAKGRKLYDLPERVYGHSMPPRPSLDQHVSRRLQSTGLLPFSGGGTGWLGAATGRIIGNHIKTMVAEGLLVEVAVEGVKSRYVVRLEDSSLLQSPPHTREVMLFLAPLDNFLWDRQLIHDIFGFFFRWEVYTPPQKRSYGYYTLPILDGHSLIGRIEPVLGGGILTIKNVWWEPGVRPNLPRFEQAVDKFKLYTNATEVVYL